MQWGVRQNSPPDNLFSYRVTCERYEIYVWRGFVKIFFILTSTKYKYFDKNKLNMHLVINLKTSNDMIDYVKIIDHLYMNEWIEKAVLEKSVESKNGKNRRYNHRVNLKTFESGYVIILGDTTPYYQNLSHWWEVCIWYLIMSENILLHILSLS